MRLLVIVSTDYGELGNALYFLHGHAFDAVPLVMLPPALRDAVETRGDLVLDAYRTLADLRRAILAYRPDAVLLCSGYLLHIGPRFSLFNGLRLLGDLRRRRVPVLTSDPFLGLVGGAERLDFASVIEGDNAATRRIRSLLAAWRTSILGRRLRKACHVYPAPVARLRPTRTGVVRKGYFNAAASSLSDRPAEAVERRDRWVFVLSQIDYRLQSRRAGPRFVEHLAARLLDAAAVSDVTLIAPPSAVAAVRDVVGDATRIELRSHDRYAAFMACLTSARYAFFWNIYSFSLLHRVLAGRPALFFSEGHMVEIMPALHGAGIDLFYGGWRPPLLTIERPLDVPAVDRVAAITARRFAELAEELRRGEEPGALLDAFVHRINERF